MILAATFYNLHPQLHRFSLTAAGLALIVSLNIYPEPLLAADEPAPGMFLIATHDLTGSGFSESVILLIQHDEDGTVGLVINQPTDIDLATIVPEVSHNVVSRVYLGGPVATYGVILLIKSTDLLSDADHVFGNIYASGSRDLLLELMKKANAKESIRLYAGHAGWFPGQLDYEISRGSWQVVPASERVVFSEEPLKIWRQLLPPSRPIIVHHDSRSPMRLVSVASGR
jgi:putative transcriptional regulator